MKITFAVRVSTDQYWDTDRVEREISVSADADEVLIASALAALPFLKKLTQQAIQERITSRNASEALAALEAQKETEDEDSTDEG